MPYKYTDNMQIDLSNLQKNPNGSYDWKGSIGAICKFNYKGIEGEVILKGYSSDRKVTISYQGNDYTLLAIPFKKGNLSCLFQQRVYEYRWNIGDIIHQSKQDLEVLEQLRSNRGERKYKLKCLTCKNIFESCEQDILKGRGCSVCNKHIYKKGINDITITDPWMVPYFPGGEEEASQYTATCITSVIMKCPNCGELTKRPIRIYSLYQSHAIDCICSTRISSPETIMYNILKQFNIQFETQIGSHRFNWITGQRKYDFYLPDYNCIIETHGEQHYKDCKMFNSTAEQQAEIDLMKKEIAINNGIQYYFEIDCSDCPYKLDKMLQSCEELFKLLNIDVNDIDLNNIKQQITVKQLNQETLNKLQDYINNNPNVTRNDIMNYMGFGKSLYQKYMSLLENKPTWYHIGRPKVEERSFVWQKS